MTGVRFPDGFHLDRLVKATPRKSFTCGQVEVDDWIKTKALQNQEKHLSNTKVLIDASGILAGYYTLATGQIDFSNLPEGLSKTLPRRILPVAVLAWLGVATSFQGHGLGRLLLAQALRDCYEAGQTFAFIAIILDCVDEFAKAFYQQYDFTEMPGYPYRLYLSFQQLEKMVQG